MLLIILATGIIQAQTEVNLTFPIDASEWDVGGSASVSNDFDNNGFLDELTICPNIPGRNGYIYYKEPLNLTACSKWTVDFKFRIYDGSYIPADGIAFSFLEEIPTGFITGQGLGVPNSPNTRGLVIGFDIYNNESTGTGSNHDNPEIQLREVNVAANVSYEEYVGLPPKVSSPTTIKLGQGNFYNNKNILRHDAYSKARIEYVNGNITVYIDVNQDGNLQEILGPTPLQFNYNYSGFLGFTASTGAYTDNHSIKDVKITLDSVSNTLDEEVILCEGSVDAAILEAGDGYNSYVWTDSSGAPLVDNDPSDPSNVLVTEPGVYQVVKDNPCGTITHTFTVIEEPEITDHPLADYGVITIDPSTGNEIVNIMLCGFVDEIQLDPDFGTPSTVEWIKILEDGTEEVKSTDYFYLLTGDDAEGDYKLYYQNATCANEAYFTVHRNVIIPIATELSPITCTGESAVVKVNNVPSNYLFSLDQINWQNDPVFEFDTGGYYEIYVKSGTAIEESCIYTAAITILEPADIVLNATAELATTCPGSPINIDLQIVNAAIPYTIKVEGLLYSGETSGHTTNFVQLSNLQNNGAYTITITDFYGCQEVVVVNEIENDAEIDVHVEVLEDLHCGPAKINVIVNGGVAPYYYLLKKVGSTTVIPQFDNPEFDVTSSGDYIVTVYDATFACEIDSPIFTINEPVEIEFDVDTVDINCFGSDDGQLTINVSGGASPLDFKISGPVTTNYSTQTTYTNLPAGTYNVTVRDKYECTSSQEIIISEPAVGIAADVVLTQDFTCTTEGIIEVQNVTGGVAPYQYSIDGVNFQASNQFTGLVNGIYNQIAIQDANGCTVVLDELTINDLPEEPVVTSLIVYDCTGNGTVELTTNPTGTYSYRITNPTVSAWQTSNIFADLAVGNYTVEVDYGSNCIVEYTFQVEDGNQLGAELLFVQNNTCKDSNDGIVKLLVSNYYTNYQYSIDGGATFIDASTDEVTIGNLEDGTYNVIVKSPTNALCEVTTNNIEISEPTDITVTVDILNPSTCANPAAEIQVTATGGTPTYEYKLLDFANNTIVDFQNSNIIGGLTPNTYFVEVRDANGCTVTSAQFEITSAEVPTVAITTPTLCYDGDNNAQVIATVTGGIAPYEYSLNGGAFQASNTFNSLTDGTYTVQVRDAYGCMSTSNTVTIFPQLIVGATLEEDLVCFENAVMKIEVAGGNPPYEYYLSDGVTPTSNNDIHEVNFGATYTFIVKDANGCTLETNEVVVTPNLPPLMTINQPDPILCFGDLTYIEIDATNGTFPYEYSINGGLTWQTGNVFSGLTAGTYDVVVRDSKNCQVSQSYEITQPDELNANVESIEELSCVAGESKGQIHFLNIAGGTPPYKFRIIDNDESTTNAYEVWSMDYVGITVMSYTDLPAGLIYYPEIQDANGCIVTFDSVYIYSPPTEISLDVTNVTEATCSSGATVKLTVLNAPPPLTGNPEYQFTLDGGLTWTPTQMEEDYTYTGLVPGVTYYFGVQDKAGCKYLHEPYEIDNTDAVHVDIINTKNTCFGDTNGEVEFTINNTVDTQVEVKLFDIETQTYIADFIANTNENPYSFTGIPAGIYRIEAYEQGPNFCLGGTPDFDIFTPEFDLTGTVSDPAGIKCSSETTVVMAGNGGFTPYQYAYVPQGGTPTDADYSNNQVLHISTEGMYDFYIKDNAGCDVLVDTKEVIKIPEPTLALTKNNCTTDGVFTIDATITDLAGSSLFVYELNGTIAAVVPNTTYQFEVGTVGIHTVKITDVNGCSVTETIEIHPEIELDYTVNKQIDCSANPSATVTINATGGTGDFTYYVTAPDGTEYNNGLFGLFTANITTEGDYIFKVEDNINGCEKEITVHFDNPNPVEINNIDVENISCNGLTDGKIIVNINNNGDIPYEYSLNDVIYQTENVFENLAAGTYTVFVRSSKECKVSQDVTITEPLELTFTTNVIGFSCNADNLPISAKIEVNAQNGTAPYEYEVLNAADNSIYAGYNSDNIIDIATSGNYIVNVRDSQGCIETSAPIFIEVFQEITSIDFTTITDITCTNPETVQLNVIGGSGIYEYELIQTPSVINNTGIFDLEIGSHLLQVTDLTTGCTFATSYLVEDPNVFDINVQVVAQVSCYGGSDGKINVELQGGIYTGSISYEIVPIGTSTPVITGTNPDVATFEIDNIPNGNYILNITQDVNPSCTIVSDAFTVGGPLEALEGNVIVTTPFTCATTAAVKALGNGGWDNYSYALFQGTTELGNNLTGIFENLNPGNYVIQITDDLGCQIDLPFTIDTYEDINADLVLVQDITCSGDATGIMEITNLVGGEGLFSFSIYRDGQFLITEYDTVFDGLITGEYYVEIADQYGCTFTTNTVQLGSPDPLLAAVNVHEQLGCDVPGQVEVSGLNGSGNYYYSNNGLSFNPNPIFLITEPGEYTFYVQDLDTGCVSLPTTIEIDPVPELSVNLILTNAVINCPGEENAFVTFTTSPGQGNLEYFLYQGNNVVAGPTTDYFFDNLGAGTYRIKVVSNNDCFVFSDEFTIEEPLPLSYTFQDIVHIDNCNNLTGSFTVDVQGGQAPYVYDIVDGTLNFTSDNVFDNLEAGVYQLEITDALGCIIVTDEIEIIGKEVLGVTGEILQQEICEGDSNAAFEVHITGGQEPYSTSLEYDGEYVENQFIFDNLEGGQMYVVYIKDANGCEAGTAITFDAPFDFAATYAPDYSNCYTQNDIIISVTEGVPEDYTYILNGDDYYNTNVITDLAEGTYSMEVVHNDTGCNYFIENIEVETVEELSLSIERTFINELTFSASGGIPPLTYTINPEEYMTEISPQVYEVSESGVYEITVTDANGCSVTQSIEFDYIDINIPNFFTPNGDGIKDFWYPEGLEYYPDAKVSIFDRYGRRLGYYQGEREGWNGEYDGKALPSDDYWFTLELSDEENRHFKGNFTLYR
ncbi:T9SS type B sorting domain-containing protein [Aureivirga marina]|uniref:T9SS type B sorting domain-containing protein n=1 Tax=Aureivirga marina TaxID=1182451 RepID=UPI0018CA6695|nr:T9SS type B sorting domain-containing protein [Aureivirga marina]